MQRLRYYPFVLYTRPADSQTPLGQESSLRLHCCESEDNNNGHSHVQGVGTPQHEENNYVIIKFEEGLALLTDPGGAVGGARGEAAV